MKVRRLKSLVSATLVAMITVAGCSGDSPVSDPGTGDSPDSDSGTGLVSLAVSDAPVQNVRQVCIEFTEAEFKKAGTGNQVFVFDPPEKVDLLAYQGMNAAPLLVDETLEAGEYVWVRLAVNAPQGGNGGTGAGMNDTECIGDGSYVVTEFGAINDGGTALTDSIDEAIFRDSFSCKILLCHELREVNGEK